MATRDLGALDGSLAGAVYSSGLTDKVINVTKFGYNPDVDTSTEEDVWDVGGQYPYATVASALSVVSTSTGDGPAGAGIWQVFIVGLDSDFNEINEILDLNGTTPVETVGEYYRIYRMRAYAAGSAGDGDAADAQGDIVATSVVELTVQAAILTGNTSTKMSMFTAPANYTGFVTSAIVSGGPNDDFAIDFQIRSTAGLMVTVSEIAISNSAVAIVPFNAFLGPIPEKTDIKAKAIAISNNAQVRVGYSVVLVRNDYLASLAKSI